MKMSGEELIPASRQRVWAALNDAEVLRQCIPGCEKLEKKSPTEFEATVVAKVGPVKARFGGNVTLSKMKPPESYVISGQGKGGAAGFAKGGAQVKLAERDGGTILSYDVDAQVGGKLAQIGSRLIDSTAKKMASDFFKRFAKVAASDIVIEGEAVPAKPKARVRAKAAPKAKPAAKAKPARKAARAAAEVSEPEAVPKAHAVPPIAAAQAAPERPAVSDRAPAPAAAGQVKPLNWFLWLAGIAIVLWIIYFLRS